MFTSLPEVVDEPESSSTEKSSLEDDCYEPLADYRSPTLITQAFLNDLVRDLNLPKESAELLGSRLQPGCRTVSNNGSGSGLSPAQNILAVQVWFGFT